jgi:L-alanine-DL-glutamate epimerase-like enolase superfamily enzyme
MALEHHSLDVDWWADLVHPKPEIRDGHAVVPDRPGLGLESLNEELIKKHLHPNHPGYFAPTTDWDNDRSNDRMWS